MPCGGMFSVRLGVIGYADTERLAVMMGRHLLELDRPPEIKHILVPLDGSALAESVVPPASALGALTDAAITLLHVIAPEAAGYETDWPTAQSESGRCALRSISFCRLRCMRSARWPIAAWSRWNRAVASGKITLICPGPMVHEGRRSYLDDTALLASGQSYMAHTTAIIVSLVRQFATAHAPPKARQSEIS